MSIMAVRVVGEGILFATDRNITTECQVLPRQGSASRNVPKC